MGSSGSGNISDYPGTSRGGSGGGIGGGGEPPVDRCERAFSVRLEDIEHSDYFRTYGAPPPVGETLHVRQRKRLVAETSAGQSVGNLPTSYNYLASCMKSGWGYTGTVRTTSVAPPITTIAADFGATPPP